MGDDKPKVSDVFGLAKYGEAVNTVTKGVVDGASAFLSRICLPAAEEFGFALKDRVSAWRVENAAKIAAKAAAKLSPELLEAEQLHAHPRLVMKALNDGSWVDDEEVQEMWAGLLASSCSSTPDESNLIFMNLLSQLTTMQVRILKYSCEHSHKQRFIGSIINHANLGVLREDLVSIAGTTDDARLDRELDHLRTLGLIVGGFTDVGSENLIYANIGATSLAFNLYVRAQGFTGSPIEYFQVKPDGIEN